MAQKTSLIAQIYEDTGPVLGLIPNLITVKSEANGFVVRRGGQEITRLTHAFLAKSPQKVDAGVLTLKFSAAFDGAPSSKINPVQISRGIENAFQRLGIPAI